MILRAIRYLMRNGPVATSRRLVELGQASAHAIRFGAAKKLGKKAFRSVYGVTLHANWDDATFGYCSKGEYGWFLHDRLIERGQPFSFMDIGANQGLYSLIAAKNLHCKNVVSFEPVAATYDLLQRNVASNIGHDKVRCHNLAISDTAGPVNITLSANHSGAASLRSVDSESDQRTETIQCITGNEMAALVPADLPIIIKIDVEGHEKSVISELVKLPQASQIESIFYEVDEDWVEAAELQTMLESIGITKFERIGEGHHYDIWASR